MAHKIKSIVIADGSEHEFIPVSPTNTERGGFIAEDATSEYTQVVKLGKDGKAYTVGTDKTLTKENMPADALVTKKAINTQAARIDLIVSSPTDANPNSELFDLRVKTDGITASSAGEAVRSQITDLQNGLNAKAESSVVDGLNTKIDKSKIDGLHYENSMLYLTRDGKIATDGVMIVSGSGTGGGGGGSFGGGGGSNNNASFILKNNCDWLSKTIPEGGKCEVSIAWTSIEDGISTGIGTLNVYVNDSMKITKNINQGPITIDISNILSSGTNTVKVKVSDIYGNSKNINYTITVANLSITSNFDSASAITGDITFSYIPNGSFEKIVHFLIDGAEVATDTVTTSGRQKTFVIPQQEYGSHTLDVYFTCILDGDEVKSNMLHYDLICVDSSSTDPIITSNFNRKNASQYEVINIEYYVYNPKSYSTQITLMVGNDVANTISVSREKQTWSCRLQETGSVTLSIIAGRTVKNFIVNVSESDMKITQETDNLALYLYSQGRSNNEVNPNTWAYNDIDCKFDKFNFVSDGWTLDDKGLTVLRVSGDSRLTIPYKIFDKDFRGTGKTLEFEFAIHSVMNYDAPVISCMDNGRGLEITSQKATLKSEQTETFVQFKEDEHIRLSFVIEKRTDNKLVQCYINGILSSTVQYSDSDDFSQQSPMDLVIGSNLSTIDIYCIRIYNNNLTRYQLLDNWIYDTGDLATKIDRYERNDIFDDYGNIVFEKLPKYLPYMVLQAEQLPQYKGDKKTVSGYYVDKINEDKSFSFEKASFNVQGTSSQYYARKNYKASFKGGFILSDGTPSKTYKMNDNAVPTNTFTFKADVASSEGCNNVELVKLYNDICPYKTAPQKEDAKIRQGIDGFPIVIFWDNGDKIEFIGKYNFNNDKGTAEVFGFNENDQSWEILNNTSDRVVWKSDDFGSDWTGDFEARYPEENTDVGRLHNLATWLKSTDQTQATNGSLASSINIGGKVYTNDTAEYRLAKFKNEFDNYFEKDAMLFNYLITEIFLMVDNRAKNMFPTFYDNGKWLILPYDYDTAIGINNEGSLVFGYELEDIDHLESGEAIYNGQDSVLWVNLRQAFYNDIKAMYQNLRSKNIISYDIVEKRFEDHQAKWSEAIFNEDAYFKYLEPLMVDNNASYLSMLQGSKAEQRKWWLYNRFKYIDSKYNAGDAETDVITLRGYAKSNITVTPYADIYASIKYGSYLQQVRAFRNNQYTLKCPLDNVNDTEIYIYSSSQLKSIGDISGLKVGYADFTNAIKLQDLKIGDGSSDYVNNNLTTLYFGNNELLKSLDVRNCPNLKTTIDISKCYNIEEIYFEGSNITSIALPNGGYLKTIHLPGSITNLSLINQANITDFSMEGYSNISTLAIVNPNETINKVIYGILENLTPGSRVRFIGLDVKSESTEDFVEFMETLDNMRGIDENGNNTNYAQIDGKIYVPEIDRGYRSYIDDKYPSITLSYGKELVYTIDSESWYKGSLEKSKITSFKIMQKFNPKLGSYTEKWDATTNNGIVDGYLIGTDVILSTRYGGYAIAATSLNSMFKDCTALESVDLTNLDTSDTADMGSMFENCTSLTNVNLDIVNKSNVTNIDYIFKGCPLDSIDFYALRFTKIKNIEKAITDLKCKSLKLCKNSINRIDLNTCTNLETVDLSQSMAITSITATGTKLKTIKLPAVLDLKEYLLPDTLTKLELINQINLSSFNMSSYNNLTEVDIEGSNDCIDNIIVGIIINMGTPSKIILTGFNRLNMENDEFTAFMSKVDKAKIASLEGTIHVPKVSSIKLAIYEQKYPDLVITYDELISIPTVGNKSWYEESGMDRSEFTSVKFLSDNSIPSTYDKSYDASKDQDGSYTGYVSGTSLVITNNNTNGSIVADGDLSYMFSGCESLVSLDISNLDTSKVIDMSYMFSGCSSLTTIDTSSFNTENVTNMSSMFFNSKVSTLNLTNFVTDKVTDMSYMFSGCSKLTSLNTSSFDTSNVTDMAYMFNHCSGLKSINLTNFVTDKVTNMDNMFNCCTGIKTLDLSKFNTSKVTNMSYMLSGCIEITSFDLSNFDTRNVTDMSYMFSGCFKLVDIIRSETFDTSKVTSMYGMFFNVGISELDLSDFNTENVTSMSYMFYNCTKLTSINLTSFNTAKVTSMNNMFGSCSLLQSIKLSNFNTRNVTNMSNMFSNCSSLSVLNVSNFDTQNVTDMSNMFIGLSIESINVSNFNTKNVTSMSYMFGFCSKLKSLDLTSFDTSNVTTLSSMFYNCSHLVSAKLSSFNTKNVTTMGDLFHGCSSLTNADLSSFNTAKVTNMNSMFYNCSSLTSLSVSHFDTSNVTNMSYMFYGCSLLASLDVLNFATAEVTNMSYMFSDCTSITLLNLSNFNTNKVVNMMSMFNKCTALRSLNISKFDTNKVTNMDDMFNECGSITEYYLGNSPFKLLNATTIPKMEGQKMYIPSGTLQIYKAATYWSTYSSYFEEI